MSRDNPPKLHHRLSNGTAYICYRGKQIYLGKWGREADKNYENWLSGWLAHNKRGVEMTGERYTVPMLIAEFLEFFQSRPNHSKQDYGKFVSLAKRVCKIFPETYVDDFGPKSMKYLRDDFVQEGYFREVKTDGEIKQERRMYSRKYINTLINFLRHIFKWGVSEELVKNETYVALTTVAPLYEGDANTFGALMRNSTGLARDVRFQKYGWSVRHLSTGARSRRCRTDFTTTKNEKIHYTA